MPSAQRIFRQDAKCVHFTATVTDIREYARRDGVQVWQVALDRTAFYPTSGGQPHDTGTLQARARSGATLTLHVDDVVEDEPADAGDEGGEIWHVTTKPLLAGTVVEGSIDATRRLDHTQQHSGQHLLSAVLANEYEALTVSFHLGDTDSTIDVAVQSKDAQTKLLEQLPEIERCVNEAIAQNRAVTVWSASEAEAKAMLAEGRLRKLPARSGPMRLVEIAGMDLNACGGTHVDALGEVGGLLLRETERVKQGLRMHFVCGLRATQAARRDWRELNGAAQILSAGRGDVVKATRRLLDETKALTKERLRLREELAESHAVQLAVEERLESGLRLVCRKYTERDAEYIKLLAGKLLASVPRTVAVLASITEEPATLVVAANLEMEPGCADTLKQVLEPLGLRGGGTAALAQARVPVAQLAEVMAVLSQRLSRHRSDATA